jgi:hypothetical protein
MYGRDGGCVKNGGAVDHSEPGLPDGLFSNQKSKFE